MDAGTVNAITGTVASIATIIGVSYTINHMSKEKRQKDKEANQTSEQMAPKNSKKSPVISNTKEIKNVEVFSGNDAAYKSWIESHPDSYVINTAKVPDPSYMVLHRSNCKFVSNFDSQKEGAYTERSFIKICSTELAAMKDWLKANGRADGTSTGNCPCKPELQK